MPAAKHRIPGQYSVVPWDKNQAAATASLTSVTVCHYRAGHPAANTGWIPAIRSGSGSGGVAASAPEQVSGSRGSRARHQSGKDLCGRLRIEPDYRGYVKRLCCC